MPTLRLRFIAALGWLALLVSVSTGETLLVKNGVFLTLKPGDEKPFTGHMLVGDDGRIVAVAAGAPPATLTADRVIDAAGKFVAPGFVSAHSHLGNAGFRGLGHTETLYPWGLATSRLHRHATADDMYWFSLAGAQEFLRNGITTVWDFTRAAPGADAASDTAAFNQLRGKIDGGIRFINAVPLPATGTKEEIVATLRKFIATAEAAQGKNPLFLKMALSGGVQRAASKEVAFNEAFAMKTLGLMNQSHFLESPERVPEQQERFAWYVEAGALGPDFIFGHFIHTTPEMVAIAAKAGAAMTWQPLSNGRLASGIADVVAYRTAGLRIGAGLDSNACTDTCDPFSNVRTGLALIRAKYQDAKVLSVYEMLRLHTMGAADVLRIADQVGSLEPGRTVAVFSDADADALHVRACDEAVRIGPAAVRESYLSIPAMLQAAELAGADAVHPGYGFLSENEAFAAACEAAGLVFIGPPPTAIAAMGNKAAAKRRMLAAGVPCVPGYHSLDQADATLAAAAERIGYPLMIKAAAGGGGRGMRHVTDPRGLDPALAGARSEALAAFGSSELILEKAIVDGRHVEIQVFADAHGNVIHLGERDCSIQRRHQKVIEEAPSPIMTRELRAAMGEAAVTATRAIGYQGAGTVEFLLDAGGAFYFLEMNTRLQVEHPVTEAVTGVDLVAWQIRVAQGERLALTQAQIRLDGHAIEARLYAEAPHRGFLPQSGRVALWQPAAGLGVRVDHGLEAPCEVTPHYDPMLAKIIARGATREEARRRLLLALEDTVLLGIETNRAFLIDMLRHPEFIAGGATTAFIERHFPQGGAALKPRHGGDRLQALAAAMMHAIERNSMPGSATDPARTIGLLRDWRSTAPIALPMRLLVGDETSVLRVTPQPGDHYAVDRDAGGSLAARYQVRLCEVAGDRVRFEIDGLRQTARFVQDGPDLHLQVDGTMAVFRDLRSMAASREQGAGDLRILAPMNGRIVAVLAQAGEPIARGQRIAILEAMKMQHELTSGRDGVLAEVAVRPGDQVSTRQLIAALAPS